MTTQVGLKFSNKWVCLKMGYIHPDSNFHDRMVGLGSITKVSARLLCKESWCWNHVVCIARVFFGVLSYRFLCLEPAYLRDGAIL